MGQGKPAAPAASAAPPAGFLDSLDRTVDPCVNFYQFACGNWMAHNPVPPDQSRWGRFNELEERNRTVLKDILEKAAVPNPKRSPVEQKIGDYYASCTDEKKVDTEGAKPIAAEMQRIAAIKSRQELIDEMAHLYTLGISAVFGFGASADLHDASMMIANVDQGGLGLPNKDYYTKTDPKSVETRQKYVEHMQKMFELLGDPATVAAEEAKKVMAIENALAGPSLDPVQRRDPRARDHKMTAQELAALAPNFEFARFFTGTAAPAFQSLNVGNPEFFKQVSPMLDSVPLADWKTYLRWRVVRQLAPMLSKPFVEEAFAFNGKYMSGQQELEARWKRCAVSTDRLLGEALGQPYVDRTFGVEGKQRTLKMVDAIEKAMGQDVQQLDWMTDITKQKAQEKLAAVRNKIGYPDKWRDYSSVKIVRGDLAGNVLRASSFDVSYRLNKIGKPVDRTEWGMTPPTVNAYYSPSTNDINFPAGILQPPFFDKRMDDAVNFGAIGAVVGHELTHGFDDQGRKFDAQGNLRDWWTAADGSAFDQRAGCIVNEYSNFVAVGDVHLNGKLTLGENTADNGGVRLAYMALQSLIAGKPAAPIDGFTPEQRFFLGYAQIWCQNITPENARLRAFTDPHSLGRYRVNGVVVNMPEFQKAFSCKAGQPMVSDNACRVW
jgi:endothelin-converting enzyme/putative endopeptidase